MVMENPERIVNLIKKIDLSNKIIQKTITY